MNYNKRDLESLYSGIAGKPVLPRKHLNVLGEDTEVSVTHASGEKETFRLEDSYGKIVARQLRVSQTSDVDDYIDSIFDQGNWTGPKQEKPKKVLKDIIINTSYDNSVELVEYLSSNKDSLLSFNSLPTGQVFNFANKIESSLPGTFNGDGIIEFIHDVHLNVIPKASTGVGLGESTFSIFGSAQKGNSGDLLWDGQEVEIKTNGQGNGSGAILGGDGNINKIASRLEAKSSYINLNSDTLNRYKKQLEDIYSAYQAGDEKQSQQNYEKFIKGSDQLKQLFRNSKLNSLLSTIKDVKDFMSTQLLSKTFQPVNTLNANPNPANILPNRLLDRVNSEIKKSDETGANLPSQIATLLSPDSPVDDYILLFSEMKTYSDGSDITSDIEEFFSNYNYTDFNPKSNYGNFQRLIGSIALKCYQEKIGFDYITAGNDDKMTMVVFDMKSPSVTSIFNQLKDVPEVVFDLGIDVFEGGKWKSKTVIAKSPRIKLL